MPREKGFIAQVAKLSVGVEYTSASIGIFSPGEIAERVLPRLRGGQLFAYLFRRFGYPSFGWDEHKNLVSYMLTTPVKDVFLSVTPYMGGDYPHPHENGQPGRARHMFGYCIDQHIEEVYHQCRRERRIAWEDHARYKECAQAFEAAMRDLLRPVFIRDIPINCHGRIADDEENEDLPAVEPYHAAGYPIPRAFFKDTERYEQFCDALCTLGNESLDAGIDAVIALAATAQAKKEGQA